jgi:glycosyltransferase involved in cell wall biosynthesis
MITNPPAAQAARGIAPPIARPITDSPKVVIAHDYLTQRGGAERVVLSMHRAFPEAPIYTSMFRPETTFPEFRQADVRVLVTGRIPGLCRNHRLALPLLAPAFSAARMNADVILCSSSGWAHGARSNGRKVVYCYAPARWLYQTDRYLGPGRPALRALMRAMRPFLLSWDRQAARSADRYLTHSTSVSQHIRAVYGIDAQVVPAPNTVQPGGAWQPIHGIYPGYFLCVSRLLPYKNLDAIIAAFEQLPELRLVVAGTGPDRKRLSRRLGTNVRMLGAVSDEQLGWLYSTSRGVIAAAYEDYGLVPLEAAAFGKPTIALRWGGYLDTVLPGETGIFFESPTPVDIAGAVRRFEASAFDESAIRRHAEQYSEARFIERLRGIVAAEAGRT